MTSSDSLRTTPQRRENLYIQRSVSHFEGDWRDSKSQGEEGALAIQLTLLLMLISTALLQIIHECVPMSTLDIDDSAG